MADQTTLLAVLIALLVGLTVGKAWERYKLREGRLVDRRKLRDSPHYVQGLNFLVAHQLDQAIDELSQAASADPGAVELHIILGNLYREKGQVGRAIQLHQQLLQRPRLTRQEHRSLLLCLGLDYKAGGFVDRALEAFNEVLRLDPENAHALLNLEKLHEDQQQWTEAYAIRRRLAGSAPADQQAGHQRILAFLENQLGTRALARMDYAEAGARFRAAIDLDGSVVPAHVNIGDLEFLQGDTPGAIARWERLVEVAPDRAYLAFDRLASAYAAVGASERFPALCRRLAAANPQDWRARQALARHLDAAGSPREAADLLLEALATNPHAITLHQTMWQTLSQLHFEQGLVDQYVAVSRDAVFYQDPHLCVRCHYRSTELLWQCPHCHEWGSFIEERLTPAQELDNVGEAAQP